MLFEKINYYYLYVQVVCAHAQLCAMCMRCQENQKRTSAFLDFIKLKCEHRIVLPYL